MWPTAEEPPRTMKAVAPESVANLKETCEQTKNQLESVKDIMLRNKQSIKKKEEELQEYAKKLTKFKTSAKASRSNKNEPLSSNESTPKSKSDANISEVSDDVVDDISQANTPQAKSSLLQKKLAEDRKIFQRRSRELTESKRAVEEKVEALRQQLEEKYVAPVSVVNPVLVTSQAPHPVLELSHMQDKDNKIAELSNKIFELQAVIMDLQENLKEKDSVIDSKTKAITLMSADLSKRGKTTLDTLEDTKDEMRSMQANFVLVESTLRSKNDNLIKQLEDKSNQISALEENVQSLTNELEAQKLAESTNADLLRSTIDTLTDTKDAMKSMQENFVLIESSLKSKNDYLLNRLERRELDLLDAGRDIAKLEASIRHSADDTNYRTESLKTIDSKLLYEKRRYESRIAELQDEIIHIGSKSVDNLLIEKDNRITELEDSIEELKRFNDNQLKEINEDMSTKLTELKTKIEELESEKSELESKLSLTKSEASKEDEEVKKLTKELDDLNKNMIKLKAQYKNKLKNMQKQLENFKKVSDTNAELVKLGNQVTLLEEEKGNLQLSLVDFDELKAAAGDWKERIAVLEGKVSTQAKEIQGHIEAIAILENQKLDLMQDLLIIKQEISSLEAENAESENLRVTAEMKVVDLEEELESLHKQPCEGPSESECTEFLRQIEILTQENERLNQKLSKHEELKSSSEVGSTESFVKTGSNVDSTESFEALAPDADKADLLRKINGLTRENGVLLEKLTRYEEKGSSDTGSTESFDRIPEHGEATSRLDNLTRENYELVAKLTKLVEKLPSQPTSDTQLFAQENERLVGEIVQLQKKLTSFVEMVRLGSGSVELSESSTAAPNIEETTNVWDLAAKIESFTALKDNLTSSLQEFEKGLEEKPIEETIVPMENVTLEMAAQRDTESVAVAELEKEIDRCNALISEQKSIIEEMKTKLADKEAELEHKSAQITSEISSGQLDKSALQRELEDSISVIAEWKLKCSKMEDKLESVEHSKQQIEEGFSTLQVENKHLLEQSEHKDALVESLKEEVKSTLNMFEAKVKEQAELLSSQEYSLRELNNIVESKEEELQAKYLQSQTEMMKMEELQGHLKKLEDQVEQQDTTIASLTEEMENLRTNFSFTEKELFEASHQVNDMHEKIKNSKSLEEYNQAVERFHDKEMLVEELEGSINQKLVEINTLKTHLDMLLADNNELRQRLQEEERAIAELQEDNRAQQEIMRMAEITRTDVDNRFLDLQATHEEGLLHTKKITNELQDAYRLMEQLKIKHTDDTSMLNQRLEEVLEEVTTKTQEVADLQNELESKQCIPEEVKAALEVQLADLQGKLFESEEKSQKQLLKMKKYAAVAKKKGTQCEELESRLRELEECLVREKNEQEAKSKELQASAAHISDRDNRIVVLETELAQLRVERDEALGESDAVRAELVGTNETMANLVDKLKGMDLVTDEARELSVRMQVMETEYIQQLAEINSLKAENGFLISKQTQINERLENVEKESEERRSKLEKLEKEREIAEEMRRSEAAAATATQQTCGECATRLQNLEAKLQERDAEIENLDNELHNSIGQLAIMQENLRISTISSDQDAATMQESYNELAQRFNAVTLAHEEVKAKHEATARDNEDLLERMARLQERNNKVQESKEIKERELVDTLERELAKDREAAAAINNLQAQYVELLEKFESQKSELEAAKTQLQESIASSKATEDQLLAQIDLLEKEKQRLAGEQERLIQQGENLDLGDGWGENLTLTEDTIELKEELERQKREVDEANFFKEEKPVSLFDASIFDAPAIVPQESSFELQQEARQLKDEVTRLKMALQDTQIAAEEAQRHLTTDLQHVQETSSELALKLQETEKMRSEAEQLAESTKVNHEALTNFFLNFNHLFLELMIKDESVESVDSKLHNLGVRISDILEELQVTRADNEQLTAAQEVLQKRVFELMNEVKTNHDSGRIAELESRMARMISERDILQLQVNDVTRAYEDLKESTDGLRNLQNQLDAVAQERNQLIEELKALRTSAQQQQEHEPVEMVAEVAPASQKTEGALAESMWKDDEDSWGFGGDNMLSTASGDHVHIPVIPSVEIQLKTRVEELEDKVTELTAENAKLVEDSNAVQLKNFNYLRKLKKCKEQIDSLQQELKSQKSFGGFGNDLLEEEFKAQITNLEKTLNEIREENKKVLAEKDGLLKRIDVLTAATERFTETKEKQDVEVHVWQMRYKELEVKIQNLESGSETKESSPPALLPPSAQEKYEAELKELKDSIDALATENEELQQLLEENRTKRQADSVDTSKQVQEIQEKHAELTASNEKLKNEYNNLRKQYEQGLMDANDQVQNMRQNSEILKNELVERNAESERTVSELNDQLRTALEDRGQLESKIQGLESEIERLNFTSSSLDEVSELLSTRVQEVAGLKEELLKHQAEKVQREESDRTHVEQLTGELREKQRQLEVLNSEVLEKDSDLSRLTVELQELRGLTEKVQSLELSIESYATEVQEKTAEIQSLLGKLSQQEVAMAEQEQQVMAHQSRQQQSEMDLLQCTRHVQTQEDLVRDLEETRLREQQLGDVVAENEASIERGIEEIRRLQHELHSKNTELEDVSRRLEVALKEQSNVVRHEASSIQHTRIANDQDLPLFTFPSNSDDNKEMQSLKDELKIKNEEIENLKRSVDEGAMTNLAQELQDNVNTLYNDIAALEDRLSAKTQENDVLKAQLQEYQSQYRQPRKRSLVEQEELMKLQNELHLRDQELNELRYVVSEKEAQLRGALEQSSGDYDLRESSEKLKSKLYEKQQELETLKFTVSELQSEVANLRGLERLADEDRAIIEKLSSEKEEVRKKAEDTLEQILKQKENELDNLKQKLAAENQNLMEALGLRNRDIKNLKIQLQQQGQVIDGEMDKKNDQMMRLESQLAERDRRLAEVSITKDTEIYNMRVQLNEKNARLEELIVLSEEEGKQLTEMRTLLEVKEQQINGLMSQLDEKSKEYELIQRALQRHIPNAEQSIEAQQQLQLSSSSQEVEASTLSNELDLALYMLHQRDVRCEELTHELMQLLEERDTLQLRLSNALRINEELKKFTTEGSPKKEKLMSDSQPIVENPLPSKSEGPIEIAREAIDSPIGEDKKALAQNAGRSESIEHSDELVMGKEHAQGSSHVIEKKDEQSKQ